MIHLSIDDKYPYLQSAIFWANFKAVSQEISTKVPKPGVDPGVNRVPCNSLLDYSCEKEFAPYCHYLNVVSGARWAEVKAAADPFIAFQSFFGGYEIASLNLDILPFKYPRDRDLVYELKALLMDQTKDNDTSNLRKWFMLTLNFNESLLLKFIQLILKHEMSIIDQDSNSAAEIKNEMRAIWNLSSFSMQLTRGFYGVQSYAGGIFTCPGQAY